MNMIYALTIIFAVILIAFFWTEYKEYVRNERDKKERMELKKKYRRENDNETY